MTSTDDDIMVYAKGFYGRHGSGAYELASEWAGEFARCGDRDSEKVWSLVASAVLHLSNGRAERPGNHIADDYVTI